MTNAPTPKTLLERIGIAPRDLIIILFILVNTAMIVTGHQQLDNRVLDVQRAEARTIQPCATAITGDFP